MVFENLLGVLRFLRTYCTIYRRIQTRYYCQNSKYEIYTLFTTKKPMLVSDYNQINFIAKFPYKSPIYFKQIRPLEGEGGQTDLNELTMQKRLGKKRLRTTIA